MSRPIRRFAVVVLAAAACAGAPILAPTWVCAQNQPQSGSLPRVYSNNPSIVVEAPRWGAGIRNLQFEVYYNGRYPAVICTYQMYDAAGDAIGTPGSIAVNSLSRTTVSILDVSEDVASVRVSLR